MKDIGHSSPVVNIDFFTDASRKAAEIFTIGYIAREVWNVAAGESGPAYIAYHDNEWGVPETDSKKLFEMICLKAAGWVIVDHRPQKRENYRACFHQSNPVKVAACRKRMSKTGTGRGLIRHRGKIQQLLVMRGRTCNDRTATVCRLCLVVCQSSTTGDTSYNVVAKSPHLHRLRRPI
ncbi:DNA-3-methyladenine glycosylase I [Escherichia coli]|nr:DNA-3-methyladenine glycosylase I [Escherichia coli]